MEKRKSPRKDVILNVKITYPSGKSQTVHTRDISDGGVFLILDKLDKPIIGEVVSVEVMDDLDNKDIFPGAEAVVVRHESAGIGLAFIEMEFIVDDDI